MFRRSSRFRKKAAKSATEKDPLTFFSVFNPHTFPSPVKPKNGEDWIQVGSIDPAIKNNAIRVERWYSNGKIETIEFSHTNFTLPNNEKIPKVGEENFYYINACKIIKELCENYLEDCQYICIESQLSFAYDNVRISSHIICALCIYLKDKGNRPVIIEMDPKLKTRLLGAPPMKKKDQIKKWSVEKACEFFEEEEDIESLKFMKLMAKIRKADDIGDAKCQLKALEVLLNSKVLPKINNRPGINIAKSTNTSKINKSTDSSINKTLPVKTKPTSASKINIINKPTSTSKPINKPTSTSKINIINKSADSSINKILPVKTKPVIQIKK